MFYPDDTDYTDQRAWQRLHQSTLKQAYKALELLIPQFVQHGFINESLIEDQAIRTYDSGVIEWIQKALQRPDAIELYLHGSRQEQNVFDPESKTWEHSLLHFSKLTDPRFHDRPSQAEYYGPRLFLAKLKYKKPFDVRFPDSEAAQMLKELVPNAVTYRLDYSDIYKIIDPALKRGYDLFVIHEISVGTESYAVPDHKQVQVVDIYDSRKRVNESLADQLIDSKVARKFTYIAMAVKMHKDESIMADLVERAVDEFLSRLEDGKYARLEDAEHDRNILLDMINKVADKLYLHDEIKQGSKTAQLLAGRVDLAKIGSFQVDLEPLSGSQAV